MKIFMPFFWAHGPEGPPARVLRAAAAELSTKFSTRRGDSWGEREREPFTRRPEPAVATAGERRGARHNSRRPVRSRHLADGKGHIAFDHTSRRLAHLATPHLLDRRPGIDHRTLLEPAPLARRSDPSARRSHLGHARPSAGARRGQQAVAQLGPGHRPRRRPARRDRRAAHHRERPARVVRVGRPGRRAPPRALPQHARHDRPRRRCSA